MQDENRTLCQRLSDLEVELARKQDAFKAANTRKAELLSDIRDYQCKVRDLKTQLEKAESAELVARGTAHEAQQAQEQLEASLRDQSASSKTAIGNLQLEIKSLKTRLAEKEEQYESALEQVHCKEVDISALKEGKAKADREGSSRVANLNQVLMQTKQTCAQLAEENDVLRRKEQELIEASEGLQRKYDTLVAKGNAPCTVCLDRERQHAIIRTPLRSCSTPIKPIPEETEMDALQIENTKLKQEFQCLQTNFQLTSRKSTELKREMKEVEKSLSEIQLAYDQVLGEKEDLHRKYEEARVALVNKSGSEMNNRQRSAQLEREVEAFRSQLEALEQRNFELQDRLKTEIARQLQGQDLVEELDTQIRSLKQEKSESESELAGMQCELQKCLEELETYRNSSVQQTQKLGPDAISVYGRKLSLLQNEKQVLSEQLSKVKHSIEETESHNRSLKEKNKALECRLASLEAQHKFLTEQRKEGEHSQKQCEIELRNELVRLSDRLEAVSAKSKEFEEAKEESACHVRELSKANSKLQREANHHWELAKKLQRELEKQESSSFRAEESLQVMEQQFAKTTMELENLKQELSCVNNSKKMYEVEVSKLMSRLEELEQSNFELSAKLADTEMETQTAKLSQTEVQSKIEELDRKLASTEDALLEKARHVTDLRNSSELMERENGTLLSQVNSLTEMVASRNAKLESLQSQLLSYETDSKEIATKVCELETEHGHWIEEQAKYQLEIDSLKESMEVAASYKKDTENSILLLKLELKQLQEYNGSLEAINTGLQDKITSQIARNEELVSRSHDQDSNLHDIERDLKMKSAALKASSEEVDFIKKSSEDAQAALKTELEALEAKCNDLRGSYECQNQEKSRMVSQISQLTSDIKELRDAKSEILSERARLVERREESQVEILKFKEELHTVRSELKETKVELKYQHQKSAEVARESSLVREQLTKVTEQYEVLKESALGLLETSSSAGSENAHLTTPAKKKLKGILKNAGAGPKCVLKTVENVMEN